MKTILITGGAGFIGFHLARKLIDRGDRVVIADNFSRASLDPHLSSLAAHPHCILKSVDLTQKPSLPADADAVVHLAAIVGVQNVMAQPMEVLSTNVTALREVLTQASHFENLQNFIFASTSEVYAGSVATECAQIPTPEDTQLTITDPGDPRATYMLSKIYGEAMCLSSGLPVTVVRPHNIYGPRMGLAHVIPELLRQAWFADSGSPLYVASVEHSRTFCFIADAVNYLIAVLDRPGNGDIYNLGRQEPEVLIGDLAQQIIEITGKRLTIEALPATHGSPARRAPDMRSLIQLTGIQPVCDLRSGIQHTLDWYRENVFAHGEGEPQ
ncbi:NAD-dependent epimerase/dehydratase family protein [Actinomycetota bacterium]|nr:NAD-dependent epimerase/dehydratase family protein [Actinomycetota bacterium]